MHCTNIIILKMTPICICQNVQDYFKIVQSYSSSVWPINFTDLFGYLYYLYAYLPSIYLCRFPGSLDCCSEIYYACLMQIYIPVRMRIP